MANRKPLTLTNGIAQGIDNSDTLEVPAGLIVDTTTLVVDSVNNRVGIGTASPAVALDVVGVIHASTGIQFGSNAVGGSVTGVTLDDYEEGTWTPVITSSGTQPTISYTSQYGYYTKIGNVCKFQLHLDFNVTVAGTGELRCSSPFLAAILDGNWQHIRSGYSAGAINTEACAFTHNTSYSVLYSGINTVDNASILGTRIFVFNGSYLTA